MMLRLSLIVLLASTMAGLAPATAQSTDVTSIGMLETDGVRHVDANDAHLLISSHPEIIVLDVRTAREFKRGHIKGAINIDYYARNFADLIGELDPSKTYLIHCKSGFRSGRAVPIMKEEGFDAVIHMDGGFDAWKKAELPVTTE